MNTSSSTDPYASLSYMDRARHAFIVSEYGTRASRIMSEAGMGAGDIENILSNAWDEGYAAARMAPSSQEEPYQKDVRYVEHERWRAKVNAAFEACPSPVAAGRGATFQTDGLTFKVARWIKGWDEGSYWLGWRMVSKTGEDLGIGGRDERDPDQTSTEVD